MEDGHAAAADQRNVIAFLSTPTAYGPHVGAIERIDTHISVVWLIGARAYKLKRSVCLDYVDFSTLERRRAACEAEVRVNARTAPSLYLGVLPVTREADGALALSGAGVPVEWLVEMVRFDQATLFDRLAADGQLDIGLMDGLAGAIARLHASAASRPDHGGRDGMAWVVEGNASGFAIDGAPVLDRASCDRLTEDARRAIERQAVLLEGRRRTGKVRACHGDLHLRNICLVDGAPTLFDGVEFNEQISCVDVLYDLAFLLMDLWHRQLGFHANVVFNAYLTRTLDLEGLALLPLFLSCRAAVRAKTSATGVRLQGDSGRGRELADEARQYLALAGDLLQPRAPLLVAVGGWSGSGKSTLARRLGPTVGPAPGAVILRSDVIRKQLLGVPLLTSLGPEGYAPAVTRHVYQTIADRARAALTAGHAVIADAVYGSAGERDEIADVARRAGVPFVGVWLEGRPRLLAKRIRARTADASDATPEVLQRQRRSALGPLDWHRLDGSWDAPAVEAAAAALLTQEGLAQVAAGGGAFLHRR